MVSKDTLAGLPIVRHKPGPEAAPQEDHADYLMEELVIWLWLLREFQSVYSRGAQTCGT